MFWNLNVLKEQSEGSIDDRGFCRILCMLKNSFKPVLLKKQEQCLMFLGCCPLDSSGSQTVLAKI